VKRAVILALVALAAIPPSPAPAQTATEEERFRVLVFSRTTGFRHGSIPVGIAAIQRLGRENGFGVDATEDPAQFTSENLRRYAAVIFLSTTGTVLGPPEKAAFERYISGGGGYVGIHSAADTEYDWPFYARVIGAYFKNHPLQQTGAFIREDARHPATAHLAQRFTTFDEFYSFRTNPRNVTHVLLRIDESSYAPDPNTSNLPGGSPGSGAMGDHPMSWCHRVDRGRSFYTALGHEPYLYSQDWYVRHLLGGIRTAAGDLGADCSTPADVQGGADDTPAGAGPGEPPQQLLRLTRTCVRGGRLRMRLTGDGGNVRRVQFKLGKRLVRSDGSAPFAGTLSSRTLRRTRARSLRALAQLEDGSVRRVVVTRTLPRCGRKPRR
jgi:type 1 glutamine amidotransferase